MIEEKLPQRPDADEINEYLIFGTTIPGPREGFVRIRVDYMFDPESRGTKVRTVDRFFGRKAHYWKSGGD